MSTNDKQSAKIRSFDREEAPIGDDGALTEDDLNNVAGGLARGAAQGAAPSERFMDQTDATSKRVADQNDRAS